MSFIIVALMWRCCTKIIPQALDLTRDIHESVALFYGELKACVRHERGILWWYCLVGGAGWSEGDNTMQVSLDESVLNKCFRWVLDGAAYSLFLSSAGGMLTFKQSCMEQTKPFLLKGF